MGLKPTFTKSDVQAAIAKKLELYRKEMLKRLMAAGEHFVRLARSEDDPKWHYHLQQRPGPRGVEKFYKNRKIYTRTPGTGDSYTDWSGNLRNSMGYIVVKDGVEVVRNFKSDSAGAKGASLALEEAPAKGYCLIAVAGMEYAAAVESYGFDVITSSSQQVESWLRNALSNMKTR